VAECYAKSPPQFETLDRPPGANSDVDLLLLMFSRRDFLGGACAFLLPQLSRKSADLKSSSALSPLRFREVAQHAGLDFVLQNNGGFTDLVVAGVYRNILYRNLGNGKFEDVTKKAGIKCDKWSVAAGWFDYDNDGWLDLFVVNYAHWTPDFDRYCGERDRNLRVYCHPKYFEGLSNTLYRNRHDGTFEDVSLKSGIAAYIGRGMSVAFADYDNDGWMDVFVTNDNLPNF